MAERNPRGPLDGVKVLDMTEHMAGPFCTMILADMGADVIKVERPGAGDSSRGMGDGSERNPYFRYINRNKKSLTLDYKGPRGREIFLKLIPSMDVLVENYRPTVMDRAGLGWEALRQVNPRLIYAQLSGFGSDGPYREKGGFDLIAQGMGGIMHVTGEPDGPPTSVGLPICDLGTGMWGAQGVLAALYERQRTGQGQKVECSLLETAVGFSSWTSAGWLADHVEPVRMGSRHRQNAPYQRFETKDGYMMIGAAGQSIWQRCARALGHPEWLEDPRFARSPERRKNRVALEKEITAVGVHTPEFPRSGSDRKFVFKGVARQRGMICFDIQFEMIDQAVFLQKVQGRGRISVVLVFRWFAWLGFDQELSLESDLLFIIHRQVKKTGHLLLLLFEIGVQQRFIPFPPAPENIVFAAQFKGGIDGIFHLCDRGSHDMGIGIGSGPLGIDRVSEQIRGSPEKFHPRIFLEFFCLGDHRLQAAA